MIMFAITMFTTVSSKIMRFKIVRVIMAKYTTERFYCNNRVNVVICARP